MKNAQIQDAKCIKCGEGITNPVCPECLAKEIIGWKPNLRSILIMPGEGDGVRCLFCGKWISICAHCYSMDVYDLLGEKYPELAQEFAEHFDLKELF